MPNKKVEKNILDEDYLVVMNSGDYDKIKEYSDAISARTAELRKQIKPLETEKAELISKSQHLDFVLLELERKRPKQVEYLERDKWLEAQMLERKRKSAVKDALIKLKEDASKTVSSE